MFVKTVKKKIIIGIINKKKLILEPIDIPKKSIANSKFFFEKSINLLKMAIMPKNNQLVQDCQKTKLDWINIKLKIILSYFFQDLKYILKQD